MKKNYSADIASYLLVSFISIIGIVLVFSATQDAVNPILQKLYLKQLLFFAIGLCLMYLMSIISLNFFYATAYLAWVLSCGSLIILLFQSSGSGEVIRWFTFGPIKIQPSEFAKLAAVLALARFLSTNKINFENIITLIIPILIVLIPFGLIVVQPDLGTSLVFTVIIFPMFYWSNLKLSEIFFLISPMLSLLLSFHFIAWGLFFALVVFSLIRTRSSIIIILFFSGLNLFVGNITPLLWNKFLNEYQKNRILTLFDPQQDPLGAGYQVIQSKVSIGSGGLDGKGFLQGSQTNLSFLPEQHTDFIFSVLGEQFGFAGTLFVIILFFLLIFRLILFLPNTANRFTNLLTVGIISILVFHFVINISMTIGLMPVTGLPLPFLSYGGSFLITLFLALGMIVSPKNRISDI